MRKSTSATTRKGASPKAAPKAAAKKPLPPVIARELPVFATREADLVKPSAQEESRLFAAARQIQDIAPWRFLQESDVLAVRDPASGETGFVSVMGQMGEHFGVLVYRGEAAWLQLLDFVTQPHPDPHDLLKISQLQLTFDAKEILEDWHRAALKRAKISTRSRGLFPTFHSLQPAYLPWQIDSAEARFMATVLEQFIEVLQRPNFTPALLGARIATLRGQPNHAVKARTTQIKEGQLIWQDDVIKVGPAAPFHVELPDIDEQLEKIAAKPVDKTPWELDFEMMPMPLMPKGERPWFPEAILLGRRDMILDQQTTTQSYWAGAIPEWTQLIVDMFVAQPKRPAELWFCEPRLLSILVHFQETGIKLVWKETLPSLAPAFEGLFSFLATGMPPDFDDDFDDFPDLPALKIH